MAGASTGSQAVVPELSNSGADSGGEGAPGGPARKAKGKNMSQGGGSSDGVQRGLEPRAGAGFFDRYKPEQGVRVRNGTVIGGGLLAAWGAKFVYERVVSYRTDEAWTLLIAYGIPVAVTAGLALFIYWISYKHRPSSDFLIATEGEMKKVSWSSRREVIGSTKVVIVFTLLIAFLLGLVDFLFMWFFQAIGVLKVAGPMIGDTGG